MTKFRDIITEAVTRSNLNPRKKDIPTDMFVTASNLLKGIFQEYSNRNFLAAYQSEVNFTPNHESIIIGEGTDAEVAAPKIQNPTAALFRNTNGIDYTPLNFVSYNQFYSIGNSDFSVSWQPIGQNLWKVYFKPRFLTNGREVKIIYNVEIDYNDDDVISLPTPYIELLTRALAYKLTTVFARTDTTKASMLKNELDTLENQLEATNASRKIITRDNGYGGTLLGDFIGGRFIY